MIYKGIFIPVWSGFYSGASDNPSFQRGGLRGLSRAIKAEKHDAAVCVEEDDEKSIRNITDKG